ncbi:glycine cleavage H-protein-domain-containing protein [Pseudoneurospora amorphoporcata]|uniref:Glycine cleavage system H protein n=1 Tax=Pseudoneurospora amorphoporcata TaxID=241081 RepID=A0AAN6NP55_9PEZI|nr:glycine cleavage H-protein-domain-containing protein [Pseudoneurospora amorphoporcata]
MASIARCLRIARPSAVSAFAQSSVRIARPFSVTANNEVRKYTREHEWVELSDDKKTGFVGISSYAAKALGDVVFVELPEEGKEIQAGDALGAVESVKSASDINAPISCKVVAANMTLEEAPSTINKAPEDHSASGGWVAKIQVSEEGIADLEKLMDEAAYKEFTASEDH